MWPITHFSVHDRRLSCSSLIAFRQLLYFLGVCSFFVRSPDTHIAQSLTTEEELTLNTFHLPLLATCLISVRDLSKRESMCYILELIHHSLKARIKDDTSSLARQQRRGCFRERKWEKEGSCSVVDFDRCLAACHYVFKGSDVLWNVGEIRVSALNMESVGWWAKTLKTCSYTARSEKEKGERLGEPGGECGFWQRLPGCRWGGWEKEYFD